MGGGTTIRTKIINEAVKPATYELLKGHPNFRFPELPNYFDLEDIVEFVLDSAANLVSPPKVDGENDEFSCESLAEVFKYELKSEVTKILKAATDKRGYQYGGVDLRMDAEGFWYFGFDGKLYDKLESATVAEELITRLISARKIKK
jgi:hypothetical protein